MHRPRLVVAGCAVLVLAPPAAMAGPGIAAARTASTSASARPVPGALNAVSCRSRAFCLAAGYRQRSGGASSPLLMRWDGSVWHKIRVPVPISQDGAQFTGVSCVTARYCIAVGTSFDSATHFVPISVQWDGSKVHYLTQPDRSNDPIREDLAVDCATKSFCMAVGRAIPKNNATRPLVETWNGTRWHESTVARPNGADSAEFAAVSCPSTDRCVATGGVVIEMVTKRGVGEWHRGRKVQWQVKTGGNGYLTSADCPDASHCYAVGYRNDAGAVRPIAQTLVGSIHMTSPALRTGAITEDLNGLSCFTADRCVAVGDSTRKNDPGASRTLGERWAQDAGWRAVHEADPPGARQTFPQAVSCPSKKVCEVVGYVFDSEADREAFAQRWNDLFR